MKNTNHPRKYLQFRVNWNLQHHHIAGYLTILFGAMLAVLTIVRIYQRYVYKHPEIRTNKKTT